MKNSYNNGPIIYTVVTFSYLKQAILTLTSAKENENFSEHFIFIIDAKRNSSDYLRIFFKSKYPWIKFFIPENLTPTDKELLLNTFNFYSPLEISCLGKFIALRYISSLGLNSNIFIYTDSDIMFYSNLSSCIKELGKNAFLVSPHHLKPLNPYKEREYIQSGWINAGFFLAQNSNDKFDKILDWLINRIFLLGYQAPNLGLCCDQTWLSLMAQLFYKDCKVLRDPSYNIAYWNIENREIKEREKVFYVGKRKLVCFHFSGFSSNLENKLSLHSNYLLKNNSPLKEIFLDYKKKYLSLNLNLKRISTYNLCSMKLNDRVKSRTKILGFQPFKEEYLGGFFTSIGYKFDKLLVRYNLFQ